MATTHIQGIPVMSGRVSYVLYGRGKKRQRHLENGTDRVAFSICDMDPDDFSSYATEAGRLYGRRYQGYEVRMSYDGFDPDNPDDLRLAAETSYEAMSRLYGNCPIAVFVHTDGDGKKVHTHCLVINHDPTTGKGIRKNTSHAHVKSTCDAVCRERGLHTLGGMEGTWEKAKEGSESLSNFDRALGDAISRALYSSRSLDEFKANLERNGVTLREKTRAIKTRDGEKTVVGWSYSMLDTTCPKPRIRRRAASNLADDFSREAVLERFGEISPEEAAEARARRQRQAAYRKSRENACSASERVEEDDEVLVDEVETAANYATLLNFCRGKEALAWLYGRLEKGKKDIDARIAKMRDDIEASKRETKVHPSSSEQIVYNAASRAIRRSQYDEEAYIEAALLLMLGCMLSMKHSFFKGSDATPFERFMWGVENREKAASTVASNFEDTKAHDDIFVDADGSDSRPYQHGKVRGRPRAHYQRQKQYTMSGPSL